MVTKRRSPRASKAAEKKAEPFSAATLARELDVDPKKARSRLRRAQAAAKCPDPTASGKRDKWVFEEKHREAIKEIVLGR